MSHECTPGDERIIAAERLAERLSKVNATLQTSIDALARATMPEELIPAMLGLIGSAYAATSSAFFEVTPDDIVYGRYWLLDGRVYGPEDLVAVDRDRYALIHELARGFRVPASYLGKLAREQLETVLVDHARGTTVARFDDFGRSVGWELELNVPIVANRQRVGALCIYRASTYPFTPEEVSLAESLAKQLGLAFAFSKLSERAAVAAVERSRAESAETHVALLQSANDALRRGTERVGQQGGLEALLGAFLLEAMRASGAAGGGITEWQDQRFRKHLAIAQDGELVPPEQWRDEPMILETADVLGRDDGAFATALLSQPITRSTLDEARVWWPAAAAYHERRGHVEVWNVPCTLRGRLLAHLGLAFRQPREMDLITASTLSSLAQQMTLALELTYLGDAAKHAAVELETTRAVAAERNRMAGEIHDSLAQSFTSIALQSESLLAGFDEPSPVRATLEIIEETARRGLAEARSSVLALRPIGDAVGELQNALGQLAERCNIAGTVRCEFRTCTQPCPLGPDVRDAVLRVAQEAVNNALRHSRAKRLVIEFDVHDGFATLSVTDDGVGLPEPTPRQPGGFGMAGMRARAESLGGTFAVSRPADASGTVVRIRVPCHARASGPP